jgi:hypothetical protein
VVYHSLPEASIWTDAKAPIEEFQGINLITAKELYLSYSKELNQQETRAVHQPPFEMDRRNPHQSANSAEQKFD